MSFSDDLQGEMRYPWLDDDTEDRLLAGLIRPDDAPPGYAAVAWIVRAATVSASEGELAREIEHVAAAVRSFDSMRLAPVPAATRATARSGFARAKIVATMVAATFAGTTGLAMASALPAPAQDVVSSMFARVGISVPSSHDDPAGTGEEISGIATTTDSEGVDKGAEISGVASGGKSQAGQHGPGQHASGTHGSGTHGGPGTHGPGTHGEGQDGVTDHGAGVGPSVGAEHSGDHEVDDPPVETPDPPAPPTPSHANAAGS
jgi:hypothetical protein